MKAQTFNIYGKKHHLKAFWEDMKLLGYKPDTTVDPDEEIRDLLTQVELTECIDTLGKFNKITSIDSSTASGVAIDKEFYLPAQYAEALKFVEDQLDPKLWEELLIIGGHVPRIIEKASIKYVRIGCLELNLQDLNTLRKVTNSTKLYIEQSDNATAIDMEAIDKLKNLLVND